MCGGGTGGRSTREEKKKKGGGRVGGKGGGGLRQRGKGEGQTLFKLFKTELHPSLHV